MSILTNPDNERIVTHAIDMARAFNDVLTSKSSKKRKMSYKRVNINGEALLKEHVKELDGMLKTAEERLERAVQLNRMTLRVIDEVEKNTENHANIIKLFKEKMYTHPDCPY